MATNRTLWEALPFAWPKGFRFMIVSCDRRCISEPCMFSFCRIGFSSFSCSGSCYRRRNGISSRSCLRITAEEEITRGADQIADGGASQRLPISPKDVISTSKSHTTERNERTDEQSDQSIDSPELRYTKITAGQIRNDIDFRTDRDADESNRNTGGLNA